MKKAIALVLALAVVICLFAGCGGGAAAPSATPASQPSSNPSAVPEASGEPSQAPAPEGGWPAFDETIYIGVSIRALSNPYHADVAAGAKLLAADLTAAGYKVEVTVMECNGSDDQQLTDIKGLIAKGGANTALYVDPNNATLAAAIAEICEDAGVYWSAVWNKEETDDPMEYDHWVTFTSPDDVQCGYDTATYMFEKMGGSGKVTCMGGLEANTASQNRIKGFLKACEEYPDIEVLDTQYADWDMTKALETTETWISMYSDLGGVWCADDTMALGAAQALQNASLNGKVCVTGDAGTVDVMNLIEKGDATATWDVGGMLQGYYSTAYAVAAMIGALDVSTMTQADKCFLTAGELVSSENLADMQNKNPSYDFTDLAFYNLGPMY